LGLGIGAATAVFSAINGVLLSPLPYPEPDRIVRLFQIDNTGRRMGNVSEPNFEDWKQRTRSFSGMALMSSGAVPVAVRSETTMITGASVSREFFDVMRQTPVLGRPFVDGERQVGGARAVIVSDSLWRSRLGAAPLSDLTLRISNEVHQVVGVMPPGFDYPGASEFWTPREITARELSRTAHNFQVVARLAPAVALPVAQAEISALSRQLKTQYGDGTWMSDATAVPLREQLTATAQPTLLVLFGAAMLLLIIACLNVSNLQLARASSRRREIAVRLAVGAGGARITRQLLAEAIVLSTAAVVLGIAIALVGVRALVTLQPGNLPRLQSVQVDWRVMLFAIGVAVTTAVVLGLVTSIRASRQQIRDTLSEGTRTMAGGKTSERVRQGLVVVQVALTVVLLIGAGLLARSFAKLLAIDPGYRTDSALVLDLSWPFSQDPAVHLQRKTAQHELMAQLAVPGVESTGLINAFPLGSAGANGQFIEMTRVDEIQSFDDRARLGDELKTRVGFAGYRIVSEGYFSTMGIPLIRGRLFDERDGPDAPHVAVISKSLADTKWQNQDPIGRFVQFGNMDGDVRGFRIVGVVGDVREISPETSPGPLFYGYYRQRMATRFSVVLRTTMAGSIAPSARQVARQLDPDLPIQIRTIEDAFDRALAGRRFSLTLIVVFSAVALLLATLGIYGLISYLVAERTREIGIRLALGAESTDVLRLVIGKGAALAAVGLGIGLVAALGLTRLLKGMLFGVTATDPTAFIVVALVTFAALLMASYTPARRAMRVSPVIAMRAD
jgi:putative ABC transport system permease protein